MDCEGDLLFRFLSFARLQNHVATAQVALNHEFQALLAARNLDCLSKLLEISANLLKLCRRNACNHLVVLLGNLHVFTLNGHEFQIKVSQEIDRVCIVLVADLQRVIGSGHLQDLGQGIDVHSQGHRRHIPSAKVTPKPHANCPCIGPQCLSRSNQNSRPCTGLS
eukprot:Skav236250  [mRNA]  locus=scaffold829:371047:372023:+ [translate_table: standard]